MNQKKFLAVIGAAIVIASMAAGTAFAALPAGPAVSVQVRGLTKTLLKPTTVRGEKGWITKGGTPKGKCPGKSGAGALDRATHGKWAGKYFASVQGIFITSILGVKPKGVHYWSIYVNGKLSGVGVCAIKLTPGKKLLFKIK